MTNKKIARFAVPLAIVVLLLAGYWYWSPFWDLRQMAAAAQKGDADAFNAHVDYPKLRESLKGQFAARMGAVMGRGGQQGNPFAGLGAAIGMGLANQMVEAMVRPEFVMRAMQEGRLTPQPGGRTQPGADPGGKEVKWNFERQGFGKLVSYPVDPAQPDAPSDQRVALVFERSGFATWKLTELRLPAQP